MKNITLKISLFLIFCTFFSLNGAESPGTYKLKVGDKLQFSIYGVEDTDRKVEVDPRGTVSYLFIDSMDVLDKTIADVKDEIESRLSKYYRFPVLSITPTEFQGEFYSITGRVVDPGRKPYVGSLTILSAICDAGGFMKREFRNQVIDISDLDKSFLVRKGQYIPVDFHKLVLDGDLSQDVKLEPSDYIYIANAEAHEVFVVGEVFFPTTIDYFSTMSVAEALAEAGGTTSRASSRAVVLRGSLACPVHYLIDINLLQKGCACDFIMQPGDILYVPPMRFTYLKEWWRLGIGAFITTIAADLGTEAFLEFHPHARGELIDTQPIIGVGVPVP